MSGIKRFFRKLAIFILVVIFALSICLVIFVFVLRDSDEDYAIFSLENVRAAFQQAEEYKTQLQSKRDRGEISEEWYQEEVLFMEEGASEAKRYILYSYFTMLILPIVIAGAAFTGLFFLSAWPKRCKKCKKWFAIVKSTTNHIGSNDIMVKKQLQTKNIYGDVTGSQEQYIPGTRGYYETIYKCKHCGAKIIEKWSRDVAHT
ncbi:MAG: hypothetical protein ACOYJB_08130 [Christensenellaceae bacterium]